MTVTSSSTTTQPQVGRKKISPNLWLPLSPFPADDFDVDDDPVQVWCLPLSITAQLIDFKISGHALCSALNSPTSSTPTWMQTHHDLESSIEQLKSEFEDWDDPTPPNSSVIIEEDGVQTLLIHHESQFFIPPPPPPPFGYAPSSNFYADHDIAVSIKDDYEADVDVDSESTPDALLTPIPFHSEKASPVETPTRKSLFVDTSHPGVVNPPSGFILSSSLFYSPDMGDLENPAWAANTHGYMYDGPDVPSDCIYSAGDISPVDRWEEVVSFAVVNVCATNSLLRSFYF